MSTLTIRLPDDTAERLKTLARSRKLNILPIPCKGIPLKE